MTLNDYYANQILDFICKHAPYIIQKAKALGGNPKQTIRNFILKHMEYKTIVVLWDGNEIIGVANFDVMNESAHVKQCVIHPQYRNKHVLKQLTLTAIKHWPFLRNITFKRELREDKTLHEINLGRLLHIPALA